MSIQSKADYREYLKADREVNHINTIFDEFNYTWIFIKALRRYEYYSNTKRSRIWKLLPYLKLRRWGLKTGITIRKNCFGKGLYIPHYGSIVVNYSARFGDYCVVQNGVNISSGVKGGDHVYLGAGAKILRNVEIAD